MRFSVLFVLVASLSFTALATDPLLREGDRLALLGGTFIERMQSTGALEAELQCRRPEWLLSVRNLGWSGDDVHGLARKRFNGPDDGFARMLADVETADPTVVLVAYGFSEASDGESAVARFEAGLEKLVGELGKADRRVILMTPVAMPGYRVPRYREWVERCRRMIESVAERDRLPVIKLDWEPSADEVTFNGLLPSEPGYERFASLVAERLVGGQPCDTPVEKLRDRIADKNELFFHHYRPQNETYLFLFRKHEQGNNAVEVDQFRPLIRRADAAIWELAAGK